MSYKILFKLLGPLLCVLILASYILPIIHAFNLSNSSYELRVAYNAWYGFNNQLFIFSHVLAFITLLGYWYDEATAVVFATSKAKRCWQYLLALILLFIVLDVINNLISIKLLTMNKQVTESFINILKSDIIERYLTDQIGYYLLFGTCLIISRSSALTFTFFFLQNLINYNSVMSNEINDIKAYLIMIFTVTSVMYLISINLLMKYHNRKRLLCLKE